MELMLVITVIGILAAVCMPRISQIITREGANQAAGVVANDLEYSVSLAARQRKPVRVACDCTNGLYTVSDRSTGNVIFRRRIGGDNGGLNLTTLSFSLTPVDIFPSGLTTGALTVTVTATNSSRQVTMSTAGFVRVVR